jgi:hypothetical protein
LERIAQHAGFKIHISPELAAGKRVTVHSIGSSYDELLDAIAGEFDLKCSPTPEGRLLDVMPLVRYEKVGLHLVQQSQSYAQRRTFEFMRRLSTSELNRLEKGESVSISSLSTACRVPIEDAVRARFQTDAVVTAMVKEHDDLGEGVVMLDKAGRYAPTLRFRRRNIPLADLMPYAGLGERAPL